LLSHPLAFSPGEALAAAGRRPDVAVVAAVLLIATVAFAARPKDDCQRESDYFCINVSTAPDGVRQLELDLLIHGKFDPSRPDALVYDYVQLYSELIKSAFKRDDALQIFSIGGGTYSMARYMDKFYDRSHNLVAEIDPEVTQVARESFALRNSPDIQIIHDDARRVLRDRPDNERYDLVLGDAFNDISIPYHLTTREFNDMVARHLTPRGFYLTNVVDGKCYDFLRSYLKTLKQSLPNVGVLTLPGQSISGERGTLVIVSGKRPLPRLKNLYPYESLVSFINRGEKVNLLKSLVPFRKERARKPITLEDDHVPVDQLLAPVFGDSLKEAGAPAGATEAPSRCPSGSV
jgi:predicted membrane-bound spermidine synthase